MPSAFQAKFVLLALFSFFYCRDRSASQDPIASRPDQSSPSQPSSSSETSGKKYSHQHDFLVHGTVFDERALSFPGVELKIRRLGEKKFRWDTFTNSRGEFAVRVPLGAEYEIVVRTKGFAAQIRAVNAKDTGNEEVLVFRMTPQKEGKQ